MKPKLHVLVIVSGIALCAWMAVSPSWGAALAGGPSLSTGPASAGDPLSAAAIVELERYVKQTMRRLKTPGLAMVLVQGDTIVYSRGLGVRDRATKQPVTTETLFGIGSSTKPMTAVAIASLVDEGVIDWKTKVVDVLPTFALSSEQLTPTITFEDTLCMCTGVPRRMEEISVRYSEMSAEDIVESLSRIPLAAPYGLQFNYSSRMLAAGGYAAARAAGSEVESLGQAYADLMQERLLDPLNMTSSTFSIDEAVASGKAATPYYCSLAGCNAIPPQIEGIFTPIAPAGALWSTAEDVAKFLLALLNDGVSAEGRRVISSESLAHLWEQQRAIDSQIGYGLGWHVEDYHGLTVYHHPGGTVGFAAELVVIPELDVGFALLTNQLDQVRPIGRMATYRLLELLTGRKHVYDREVRQAARKINRQILMLNLVSRKRVDRDKIAPYLGAYHNPVLGEVTLRLHDDRSLWVDFGEYESQVRRLVQQENAYIFMESVFVGKTLTLGLDAAGHRTMQWAGDEADYVFEPAR